MPWTPNTRIPEANLDEPIIDNALAIITRDFQEALDYYFPAENYPDFAERTLGQIARNEFPCLAIGPRENASEEADDLSYLTEVVAFQIYIGVLGDSASDVTTKIMRYVKVMNAIIRHARQDFYSGMSNPFGLVLARIVHDYGPVGKEANIYFRSAIVDVALGVNER